MGRVREELGCVQLDHRGCCRTLCTEARRETVPKEPRPPRALLNRVNLSSPTVHKSISAFSTSNVQPAFKADLTVAQIMSNPAIDIASTLQFASIKRNPSPAHDINPSTAASIKRPVSPTTSISSNAESIPESALKPAPRRANLPPLPDLRFEQSYLASLQGVESKRTIAWITMRDQVP